MGLMSFCGSTSLTAGTYMVQCTYSVPLLFKLPHLQRQVKMTEQEKQVSSSASLAGDTTSDRVDQDANEETQDKGDHNPTFSAAQVRVREEKARLEATKAAQSQLSGMRRKLAALEMLVQTLGREKKEAKKDSKAMRTHVDEILKMHERTLIGMHDNLSTEKLVAALETEKSLREGLRTAFESQNVELLKAQERVESLTAQVLKYQKTETVLAQSIAHVQRRFDSNDQQRVAAVERIKQELEAKHLEDKDALKQQLELAALDKETISRQLQELQTRFAELQERSLVTLTQQKQSEAIKDQLIEQLTQLETDKAVLASRAEQLQRADAQLRGRVNAQSEQLQTLEHENQSLRLEKTELTQIATDLMEMAERQHAENKKRKGDGEALASTRKRLRKSIG